MGQQSSVLVAIFLSRSVLGRHSPGRLQVMHVTLVWALKGLVFCRRLLQFLFVRCHAVFHVAQFYFDLTLVRLVVRSSVLGVVNILVIEVYVTWVDVVAVVRLDTSQTVLIIRRITIPNLLTGVPDLILALPVGIIGIMHHRMVVAVSHVELVLPVR